MRHSRVAATAVLAAALAAGCESPKGTPPAPSTSAAASPLASSASSGSSASLASTVVAASAKPAAPAPPAKTFRVEVSAATLSIDGRALGKNEALLEGGGAQLVRVFGDALASLRGQGWVVRDGVRTRRSAFELKLADDVPSATLGPILRVMSGNGFALGKLVVGKHALPLRIAGKLQSEPDVLRHERVLRLHPSDDAAAVDVAWAEGKAGECVRRLHRLEVPAAPEAAFDGLLGTELVEHGPGRAGGDRRPVQALLHLPGAATVGRLKPLIAALAKADPMVMLALHPTPTKPPKKVSGERCRTRTSEEGMAMMCLIDCLGGGVAGGSNCSKKCEGDCVTWCKGLGVTPAAACQDNCREALRSKRKRRAKPAGSARR